MKNKFSIRCSENGVHMHVDSAIDALTYAGTRSVNVYVCKCVCVQSALRVLPFIENSVYLLNFAVDWQIQATLRVGEKGSGYCQIHQSAILTNICVALVVREID